MEDKGRPGLMIIKLNEVRKLRTKTGQRYRNMMDLNLEGKDVLDSNVLIAAQRIQDFLIYRRERHAKLMRLREKRGTHGMGSSAEQSYHIISPTIES